MLFAIEGFNGEANKPTLFGPFNSEREAKRWAASDIRFGNLITSQSWRAWIVRPILGRDTNV